jgi:hypothetical protein
MYNDLTGNIAGANFRIVDRCGLNSAYYLPALGRRRGVCKNWQTADFTFSGQIFDQSPTSVFTGSYICPSGICIPGRNHTTDALCLYGHNGILRSRPASDIK